MAYILEGLYSLSSHVTMASIKVLACNGDFSSRILPSLMYIIVQSLGIDTKEMANDTI